MRRMRDQNQGFTVVEFIIAMALFGVIVVPIIMVFANAISLTVNSKEVIELNSVARQIKVDVYMAYREESLLHHKTDPTGYTPPP
jgi:prepilin-type N-terminal cleavage/methylation domain-containing protein